MNLKILRKFGWLDVKHCTYKKRRKRKRNCPENVKRCQSIFQQSSNWLQKWRKLAKKRTVAWNRSGHKNDRIFLRCQLWNLVKDPITVSRAGERIKKFTTAEFFVHFFKGFVVLLSPQTTVVWFMKFKSSVPHLMKFGIRDCYFVNETVFKKVSRKETFFNQSNDRKFENCLFAQWKTCSEQKIMLKWKLSND